MSPELSTQCDIPLGIERQLIEMGVIPATPLTEMEAVADYRNKYLAKGYYNDPRDENGEVPY